MESTGAATAWPGLRRPAPLRPCTTMRTSSTHSSPTTRCAAPPGPDQPQPLPGHPLAGIWKSASNSCASQKSPSDRFDPRHLPARSRAATIHCRPISLRRGLGAHAQGEPVVARRQQHRLLQSSSAPADPGIAGRPPGRCCRPRIPGRTPGTRPSRQSIAAGRPGGEIAVVGLRQPVPRAWPRPRPSAHKLRPSALARSGCPASWRIPPCSGPVVPQGLHHPPGGDGIAGFPGRNASSIPGRHGGPLARVRDSAPANRGSCASRTSSGWMLRARCGDIRRMRSICASAAGICPPQVTLGQPCPGTSAGRAARRVRRCGTA